MASGECHNENRPQRKRPLLLKTRHDNLRVQKQLHSPIPPASNFGPAGPPWRCFVRNLSILRTLFLALSAHLPQLQDAATPRSAAGAPRQPGIAPVANTTARAAGRAHPQAPLFRGSRKPYRSRGLEEAWARYHLGVGQRPGVHGGRGRRQLC
jgi:hypothetical protein